LRVLISARLQPGVFFEDFFLQFQGKTLKLPSRRVAFPKREYLQWHLKEVFKGQPRD
jgi:predicted restriction endonuclease